MKLLKCIGLVLALQSNSYAAEEGIRVVGSSTVYPFISVVAENFGRDSSFYTPVIEVTGTGGGFKNFCSGNGKNKADISTASRQIKKSEKELCKKNKVGKIEEFKIGYDGIVFINSVKFKQLSITREELMLALIKEVPVNGKLIDNPYIYWNEINPNLPKDKIKIYGPPPTSGTRDSFVELVMEKTCTKLKEYINKYPNKKNRKKACHQIREDGVFVESAENDNLIIQKVIRSGENYFGIMGFSFLEQNEGVIQGSIIDGATATFDNISSGEYPVSRPLYFYLKKDSVKRKKGIKEFVGSIINEDAIGEDGYLLNIGLIPMQESEFDIMSIKYNSM